MQGVTGPVPSIPSYQGATVPWNTIVWPDLPAWPDERIVTSVPAAGRALALITGMISQAPWNDMRGDTVLERPAILDRPDPDRSRSWFLERIVHDYLVHGNACALITSIDAQGWPSSVMWVPASWVNIVSRSGSIYADSYYVYGTPVPREALIHIPRGADPWLPARGYGVMEQHFNSFRRINQQEQYESSSLSDGAVPSIAVILRQAEIDKDEVEAAKTEWLNKFSGPKREPVFLPNGTVVQPLAWSPTDTQLAEARKLALTDVANIFNLDGYWVGAASTGLTYRSPGPMYLNLLRTTLEPIMLPIEEAFSHRLLPRGRSVKFDTLPLLRDDLPTMVGALKLATESGLMTVPEARQYMGLPVVDAALLPTPVADTGVLS